MSGGTRITFFVSMFKASLIFFSYLSHNFQIIFLVSTDFFFSLLQSMNVSQSLVSESSNNFIPENLDDSVNICEFEPRQSFTDSDSESNLVSEEQFSFL